MQPDPAPQRSTPVTMRRMRRDRCPVCSHAGRQLYAALHDYLFGAPGSWVMSRCENPECEALWLSEAPDPNDLAIAYQNYYTHHGDEGNADAEPVSARAKLKEALVRRRFGYPVRRNLFLSLIDVVMRVTFFGTIEAAYYQHLYLPWQPGGRLLEIGCGSGNQLMVLRRAGWTVSGVDFDPEAVATAQRRGLDVRLGDVTSLALADESFDAIVMGHVVEHTYDPVAVLKECRRLLSPGGVIVAVTPNAKALGHRIYKDAWRGLEPPRHLVVFTPKALQLAFKMAGLKSRQTRYSARDSTNMLNQSALIREKLEQGISAPTASVRRAGFGTKLVAGVERVGAWMGIGWAEEQIILAVKSAAEQTGGR